MATFVNYKDTGLNRIQTLQFPFFMTRILLLSDTHSYIDDAILKHAGEADEIWHAGDIGSLDVTDALQAKASLRAVHGNIDDQLIRREYPRDLYFRCEEVSVWITHIAGYPGKYNQRVREGLREKSPKLFICGHSHILKVQHDKKHRHLHMNPGACGKHGFHQVRTMLRFHIDGGDIQDLHVIELGKRGG